MQIKTFYFNPYRECTYVLYHLTENQDGRDAVIIDPGMYSDKEEQRIMEFLQKENLRPVLILITHRHPDHVCGLEFLLQQFPEAAVFPSQAESAASQCEEGQRAAQAILDQWQLQVLSTPGHKEDSVCFYCPNEQLIFTGDTLFQESVGRTDLPGGDTALLMQSLEKLAELPDDTQVYPGHGYTTTIGHEKENNPYM